MKKVLYLTIALFVLITVIVILGNVITIGEKMTAVIGVPYLEYAFYLLLLVLFTYLVYLAILQPMMKIHNAPEFPVLAVQDNDKGLSEEAYRKQLMAFGDKLCNNCYYLPTSKRADRQAELKTALADVATTRDISQLKSILNDELKQRYRAVDKHIITYATKVFVITAISSSNRIDTLATLGLNYRMISDIVQSSGFRPNKIQLVKIYYYVICSAFLSYFFQGVAESAVDALTDVDDVDVDIDPSEFLPGDTMTFDTEDYMIAKGTEISYWAVGTNVMIVEQGDSTQTVGNGNYYSDPLRVYSGQIITFLFLGDVPSSVVINCTTDAYALKLDGDVEGATATVSESNVTFVPDEDVQGFSVAPSAQTRLNSVHFVA